MNDDRLNRHCRWLANASLALMAGMLLLNLGCWLFPVLLDNGLDFNLTSLARELQVDVSTMPGWQVLGAVLLSSVPLLLLSHGLVALAQLFRVYGQGEYFSPQSAGLLGSVGKSVGLWVLSSVVLYPLMSLWITLALPPGERMLSLAFSPAQLVSLLLAGAVLMVARVLGNACGAARENRHFV